MSEMNKDSEQLIDILQAFDDVVEVDVPAPEQIKMTILHHKRKQKRAFFKELILFVLTACIVLTALITVLVELPIAFIITQVMLLIAMPFMFIWDRRHEEEELFS